MQTPNDLSQSRIVLKPLIAFFLPDHDRFLNLPRIRAP
jgi:hypothetical protein